MAHLPMNTWWAVPTLRGIALAALLLVPSATQAQRAPFPIPDPDPEVERKSFIVADGFEVNLFAADPILAKPIQMNFDPQGRLWVVSSEVYPQIQPGQTANDKVLVLEDRDGDGKAEKTNVFADGLLIPTGIEPGDGGAYVANSTELLHFQDTDGDLKADRKRVMLSGFGTEDTHHILHTLRWGYDGQLYFNQSIYIHSHIETPHGVRRLGGGGIWEFRPETMELDVFIRGLVNPWGHHFDRWGQSFATDGAGGEGINYCLPGAYYFTAPDAVRILPGLNPGTPKDCGLEVASGRHLPDEWQGNLLTNDFRGNRVCRYVITEDGAGYASREQPELIKTKHMAFRPIDIKMGPDGAIYIADWYNPIIQHGEVDFRDPRRDHTRGRIWRVSAKSRPLVERPKLASGSVESLLEALKAPEDWTRQQAKRVLKERGADKVVPALAAWAKALKPDDPGFEHQRLEALWTYESLNVVEPDLLASLLRSSEPHVRAAATRVVSHWLPRLSDPVALLAERVVDDFPRVRLEAVRALAHVAQPQAAKIALRALEKPVDRFLDYALWLTARQLEPYWLPEVQAGRLDSVGSAGHLIFALKAVNSPAIVPPLAALLQAGQVPRDQEESVHTLIAALGAPQDLTMIYTLATKDSSDPPGRRAALLTALIRATEQRKVRPEGDLSSLGQALDSGDDSLRTTAARAAGIWQVIALRDNLVGLAKDASASDAVRHAAIEGLALFRDAASRRAIESLAADDSPRKTQAAALASLASLDPKAGASKAVAWLADPKHVDGVEEVVSRFMQSKTGPSALTEALSGKSLPPDTVKLAVRATRATGREEPKLIEAFNRAGGLSGTPAPPTPEQVAQLVAEVAKNGDAARGEAVFRRKDLGCLKCHAIVGAGGQVGPSLESVGASAPADYLVDSILQPNKAVKENYHAMVVATTDGRIINGIKIRQTGSELVLRDAEDREVSIPRNTIEEQKTGGSLMPAGLADTLTRGELVDLVRFLSELGKIGPYSVSKARFVRRWRVLEPTPDAARLLGSSSPSASVFQDPKLAWDPAYSQVSGILPIGAVPAIKPGRLGFARAQIDVSTPGRIRLALNSAKGLTLWLDDTPVAAQDEVILDVAAGLHTLTLAVDTAQRGDGIRCALEDVAGSPARAQVVVGK
ncbi:MAG: HEAT repeat domain-containing protein [Isosphaeraceae bacterium]|nr:HEAT repeat domain-containing protein [Isosphaeraceae bacterium]